jgi:hypothetical protein
VQETRGARSWRVGKQAGVLAGYHPFPPPGHLSFTMAEYAIDDHLTLKLNVHNQMRMIRIC